ncbi:HEAT repeat domain-containing protein [Sphingobacterium sp. LRF_L2]|uniref:HEAT repeat domain-containing protein n=1 Tax=Sphingobacterium sp. LRF_L2 TaxID=3369421 RepID=UPI003F63C4C4
MRIPFLPLLICLLSLGVSLKVEAQTIEKPSKGKYKTTFAIVVDDSTYMHCKTELFAYKRAVEQKGLGAYLIHHNWSDPAQIRALLQELYRNENLEGSVFVGNIPVPMIRDAQHLTSTFKMDQRIAWQRSSVPSDRYYDDFDLTFDFIKRDSVQTNYFYYSLAPSSPQYIEMDIYSARIKPVHDAHFYEQISAYLTKVSQPRSSELLDQAMVYAGHGYHSESLNAWAGEQVVLREQLPRLFARGGKANFLNFRMEKSMRAAYLSEIQRKDLDLAIYHGHGSPDAQLLNGYPYATAPQPSIENIKRYLRNKIQGVAEKKGDVEAAKKRYQEWLDVPLSWMNNALIDSVKEIDSLDNALADLYSSDLETIRSSAKFIILDACDNGSFHLDDYIAARYPFQNGNTQVTIASSVGILQDIWSDKLLGSLSYGLRSGNWLKQTAYLETHLFGDPTFSFQNEDPTLALLNEAVQDPKAYRSFWKKQMLHPAADIRNLALQQLYIIGDPGFSAYAKNLFLASNDLTVRLQALLLLSKIDQDEFEEVLPLALEDPYELTRRLAAQLIGEKGNKAFISALVRSAILDRHSERVASRVRNVLAFMPAEATREEVIRQLANAEQILHRSEIQEQLLQVVKNGEQKIQADYQNIDSKDKDTKTRAFSIRTMRAYRYHEAVPHLIRLILDEQENLTLRIQAIEALSWFDRSYQKPSILEACELLVKHQNSNLKKEATRTLSIINSKKKL